MSLPDNNMMMHMPVQMPTLQQHQLTDFPISHMVSSSIPIPRVQRRRKTPEETLAAEQRSLTRKRTPKLTINDKVKIIYLHKHELKSYTEIGSVFRCTKSTISGIIKSANDIIEKASKMTETQSKQKCRVKQCCSFPEVEQSLSNWISLQNMRGVKVSDRAIRDQAREECLRLYNREWKPSNGWLTGFKGRMKRKELLPQPDQLPGEIDNDFTFADMELKGQGLSRWVERIKDMTWAARPDLPMRTMIDAANSIPTNIDPTQLGLATHAHDINLIREQDIDDDQDEDDDSDDTASMDIMSPHGQSNADNMDYGIYMTPMFPISHQDQIDTSSAHIHGLPY